MNELKTKIQAMLWDLPVNSRTDLAEKINADPVDAFRNDEQLFLKALNSLTWYDLLKLINKQNLVDLLTDSTIRKLFPPQRRTYYTNARRLLSKYSLPPSGQGA
jgi:hypothetical protein